LGQWRLNRDMLDADGVSDVLEPTDDDVLPRGGGGDSSLLDAIENAIGDNYYDDAFVNDDASDPVTDAVAIAMKQLGVGAERETRSTENVPLASELREGGAATSGAAGAGAGAGGGVDGCAPAVESATSGTGGWRPPSAILSEKEMKAALQELVNRTDLPAVPRPQEPVLPPTLPMQAKLTAMQRFISAFEYNYTGVTYVTLRKDRGMLSIMSSAKEIVYKALPIQCIEAVFLGVYLTRELKEVRAKRLIPRLRRSCCHAERADLSSFVPYPSFALIQGVFVIVACPRDYLPSHSWSDFP
jgi:hypothetical protein